MKHETAVTFIGCLFIATGCNTSDALLGSGDAGPAEGAVTTGADARRLAALLGLNRATRCWEVAMQDQLKKP